MIAEIENLLTLHFPVDLGELNRFDHVCVSLADEEAVHSTAHFFGSYWEDVDPEQWESQPSSISFFTPEAMQYYLPSLIRCSLVHARETEWAVNSAVLELGCKDRKFEKWTRSRWATLSIGQLETVTLWLQYLKVSADSDFEERLSKALERIGCFRMEKEREIENGGTMK